MNQGNGTATSQAAVPQSGPVRVGPVQVASTRVGPVRTNKARAGTGALLLVLLVLLAACGGAESDGGGDDGDADSSDDLTDADAESDGAESGDTESDADGAGADGTCRPTTTSPTTANSDSNTPDPSTGTIQTPHTFDSETGLFTLEHISGDEPNVAASALRSSRDNPLFTDPLVDPELIISGGPPPDGIAPIELPRFEQASAVTWLEPQEAVIAVEINGEARAYPVSILISHEIVNDTFCNLPVTITYCPLCNSAVVFERRINDRTFTFGTSGSLYNSALVMYDRQTESLWAHYTGQAIVGELAGTKLNLLPAATVSWDTFRSEYPDGIVLSIQTGFGYQYGANPYVGYDDPDSFPFLFLGEADERLPAKTRVLAIRPAGPDTAGPDAGDSARQTTAIVLDTLAAQGVIMFEADSPGTPGTSNTDGNSAAANDVQNALTPVVAFYQPGTASALDNSRVALGRDVGATAVYLTKVGDQNLTFAQNESGEFTDNETGSTWSLLGRATAGELQGSRLTPVEHLDTFWFAIAAYSSNVQIIGAVSASGI